MGAYFSHHINFFYKHITFWKSKDKVLLYKWSIFVMNSRFYEKKIFDRKIQTF